MAKVDTHITPNWKKDLISRRKANNVLGNNYSYSNYNKIVSKNENVNNKVIHPYQSLVRQQENKSYFLNNYRQSLSDRSVTALRSSGADKNYINHVIVDMKNPDSMQSRGRTDPESGVDEGDFAYGPGIVSRLKNRYMSLALRDSDRAYLRKYSSLEDLLEEPPNFRGRSQTKHIPQRDSNVKESMKRARSMDSLTIRRLGREGLNKVQMSHIEKCNYKNMEEVDSPRSAEIPATCLVKQVKQIFEISQKSQNAPKSLVKPPIKAKPPGLKEKRVPSKDKMKFTPISASVSQPRSEKLSSGKNIEEDIDPLSPTTDISVISPIRPQSRVGRAISNNDKHTRLHSPPTPLPPSPPTPHRSIETEEKTNKTDYSNDSIKNNIQKEPPSETVLNSEPPPLPPRNGKLSKLPQEQDPPPISSYQIHKLRESDSNNLPPVEKLATFSPKADASNLKEKLSPQKSLYHSSVNSLSEIIKAVETKPNRSVKNAVKDNIPTSRENKDCSKTDDPKTILCQIASSFPDQLVSPSKEVYEEKTSSYATNPETSLKSPKFANTTNVFPAKSFTTPESMLPVKSSTPASSVIPNTSLVSSQTSLHGVDKKTPQVRSANPLDHGSPEMVSPIQKLASPKVNVSTTPQKQVSPKGQSMASQSTSGCPTRTQSSPKGRGPRSSVDSSSSMVFNFSKRTETPDYIENDGVDLSKRRVKLEPGYVIITGYEGKLDSSTDWEDGDDTDNLDSIRMGAISPQPCNITFEGEGVIIKGNSNLQRQPKTKKLEVSFDIGSTSTYEYPSEDSLLAEQKSPSNQSNGGGLSSYTPSKVSVESFKLGVSRPQDMTSSHSKHPGGKEAENSVLEGKVNAEAIPAYARPAQGSETISWSSDNAPDLLF